MPSQRSGTALFDGGHDLQLPKAQAGSLAPGRSVEAEDVCDLEHNELGGRTS